MISATEGKLVEGMNLKNFNFNEIWKRISQETDLKKFQDLSKYLKVSAQNISNKKKANNFPLEWAYKISENYNLNIKWIMTGKQNKTQEDEKRYGVLCDIQKWIDDENKMKSGFEHWFKIEFEKRFPEFYYEVDEYKDFEVKPATENKLHIDSGE